MSGNMIYPSLADFLKGLQQNCCNIFLPVAPLGDGKKDFSSVEIL